MKNLISRDDVALFDALHEPISRDTSNKVHSIGESFGGERIGHLYRIVLATKFAHETSDVSRLCRAGLVLQSLKVVFDILVVDFDLDLVWECHIDLGVLRHRV